MKRIALVLLATALVAGCRSLAEDPQGSNPPSEPRFVAGQHYQVLRIPLPTGVPQGKIEVTEVFWYGCAHCYRLAPHMEAWHEAKPEFVELVRLPAVFGPTWAVHARLFYAARALGIHEQTHLETFREIHNRRNRLADIDSVSEFLSRFGVSEEAAREALTSFSVGAQVRMADVRVRGSGLTGVPVILVHGKYATRVAMAGGFDELRELIDYLVAREAGTLAD